MPSPPIAPPPGTAETDAAAAALPPLREVIARHDLRADKRLGQNFLLDLNLTARIARAAPVLSSKVFHSPSGELASAARAAPIGSAQTMRAHRARIREDDFMARNLCGQPDRALQCVAAALRSVRPRL